MYKSERSKHRFYFAAFLAAFLGDAFFAAGFLGFFGVLAFLGLATLAAAGFFAGFFGVFFALGAFFTGAFLGVAAFGFLVFLGDLAFLAFVFLTAGFLGPSC